MKKETKNSKKHKYISHVNTLKHIFRYVEQKKKKLIDQLYTKDSSEVYLPVCTGWSNSEEGTCHDKPKPVRRHWFVG